MCLCARVQARSRAACGGVDAPLTLSCRHAQANVEAASNDGRTALMFSAQGGHDACVRQLLEAKADVHAASKKRSTALKLAERSQHSKCVELLQRAAAAHPFQQRFSKYAGKSRVLT